MCPARPADLLSPRSPSGVPNRLLYDLFVVATALLLTGWVHRHALPVFFTSPDDLIHLQQAVDLRPTTPSPFRWLSQSVYFRIMVAVFGLNPLPWHVMTFATHLVNSALFFALLRLYAVPPATAGLAASLFGTMPLSLTLLSSAVGMNDELALCLTLIALIVQRMPQVRARVWAAVAFTLALFCKESVLFLSLLPIVMRCEGQTVNAATRRALPLIGVSVAVGILFLVLRPLGLASDNRVYALQPGMNVIHNLATYITWATNIVHPMPDLVSSYDTAAWPWAAIVALAFALAWRWLPEARLGIAIGSIWWLLALLPILPLRYQSYRHYLYPALPGLALAVATVLSGLFERISARNAATHARGLPPPPRPRVATVVLMTVCAIAYAGQSNNLITARLRARLDGIDISPDPVIRGRQVASRALASIGQALDHDSRLVALYAPPRTDRVFGARSTREYSSIPRGQQPYDLLAESLDHGWGVRLFFPQIDSVVFLERWSSEYRGYDLFLRYNDGHLLGVGRGPRSHELAAEWMLGQGWPTQAAEHLQAALEVYPEDWTLHFQHASALLQGGDSTRAAIEIANIVRQAPDDSLRLRARALQAQLGPSASMSRGRTTALVSRARRR